MRNFELSKEDVTWIIDDSNLNHPTITGSYGGEVFTSAYHEWGPRNEFGELISPLNDIEAIKENILLKFNKNFRVSHQNE